MSILFATLLGMIQGITEFFPISSSAHLRLAKIVFGVELPQMFDLTCHLGTLIALIWFFKKEIYHLFTKEKGSLLYLTVALFPLIPFYFLLSPLRHFATQPQFLGIFLILTGAILFFGKKHRIKIHNHPLREVFLIGVMQSTALIPGISRSGSTISFARALGWNNEKSVHFSFLLAIPTIIGGNLLEMGKLLHEGSLGALLNLECVIGFFTAFLFGILIIRFAINLLKRGNLDFFAYYCIVLGILTNIYIIISR